MTATLAAVTSLVERTRLAWERSVLHLPRSIQIEITNACNLGCKMCPSNSPETTDYTRGRTLMDFALYEKIVAEIATFPRVHLIPQGGGEPFLHKRFRDMLVLAKSHPTISVGFVTNGTRTEPGDPEFLVDLGIEEICVSVYGYDGDSHHRTTGRKNYEQVVGFLEGLAAAKAARHVPWPKVRVQTVHTREMDPHLGPFTHRWLGVADEVAILTQRDFTGRGIEGLTFRYEDARPCRKLWHETAISSDGVIGICCEDWDARFPLGNLREQTIREVWFGPELQGIRLAHKQGRTKEVPLCDGCYMLWEQPAVPVLEHGLPGVRSNSVAIFRR